jgi:hypothetical protein
VRLWVGGYVLANQGITFKVDVSITEGGKPSRYSIENDLSGQATLQELALFMRRSLINVALDVLKEEQKQGFDKKPVTLIDNRLNKPITQVKPFGKIEFKKRVKSLEIISFAYREIARRSPVDTGRYENSNFVFLNGKRIATNLTELSAWIASKPAIKENDFIRIVNVTPYARRLERLGVTRQRTSRLKIKNRRTSSSGRIRNPTSLRPNGTYFLSTRATKRKYKGNVTIYFGFIPGNLLGLSATFAGGSGKKKRTYLYPTMKIYIGGKRGVSD